MSISPPADAPGQVSLEAGAFSLEPAQKSPARPPRRGPLWARLIASEYWVLGLCAVYFAIVSAILPDIATVENLENILSNTLPLLCVALGQTFVLITAGIDLSVTSIVAASSVAGAAKKRLSSPTNTSAPSSSANSASVTSARFAAKRSAAGAAHASSAASTMGR